MVNGTAKKRRLLLHESNVGPQPLEVQVLEAVPVERNGPGRDGVPALQHAKDGALARAACAHERRRLVRRDVEVEAVQHGHAGARRVRELDAAELDVAREVGDARPLGRERVDGRLAVDDGKQVLRGGGGLGDGNGLGRNLRERLRGDEHGKDDGDDGAGLLDLARRVHADALPKGECVAGNDAEELDGEEDGVDEALALADSSRALKDGAEAFHELGERPKRVRGANRGKGLLGEGAALRVNVKHAVLEDGILDDAPDGDNEIEGHNGEQDEGELPLDGKGDDKGGDEAGDGLDGEAELLRDAVVDEVAVGGDLPGHGGRGRVEEGYLLPQRLPHEVDAQLLGGADGGDVDEDGPRVGEGELGDEEVDKVEAAERQQRFSHLSLYPFSSQSGEGEEQTKNRDRAKHWKRG